MKTLLILLALSLTGCQAIPMNHAQWEAEQAKRRACEKAGVEYKGPNQIKAEAIETRKAVGGVTFEGTGKR